MGGDCGFFTSAPVPGVFRVVTKANHRLLEAVAAHRRGQLDTAEAAYREILRAEPRHFDATHLLGAILCARGKNKEAEAMLRRAVTLNPKVAAAQNNLGNAVKAQGRSEESLAYYDRAIALDGRYADAFNNRGNVYHDLGRPEEALSDYDRALSVNPNYPNALQKSAKILADLGRYDEALVRNDRALALERNSVEAWLRSGNVLTHLNRPKDALASYDRALAIDPEHVDATVNRCAALERLGRPEEALAGLERAIAAHPRHVGALNNRATVLKSLGRMDEALEAYRTALAIAPDDAITRTNYGLALLLVGNFAEGLPEYENRWRKAANLANRPRLPFEIWDGDRLEGRSIVVYAEQGLGDIVQFSRYLPMLQATGAKVAFIAPRRMHALMRAAFPAVELFSAPAQAQSFDFQCALMSLPRQFGTRPDSIPAAVPYLKADPARVARWRDRIGTTGFKIGVCWQGNPNVAIDAGRSFALAALEPLALDGVRLVSLQKNDGVEQINRAGGLRVETLGEDFDLGDSAFLDTVAAMECLDLIVSPDTSVAHVAGALGRPVWVALQQVPDWRWMLEGSSTPWYPTMRLFRQTVRGDWHGVMTQMRREISLRASRQIA